MKKRIVKIEATLLTKDGQGNQYLSWTRENIGDMIEDIPEKIAREGIYAGVKITHEK